MVTSGWFQYDWGAECTFFANMESSIADTIDVRYSSIDKRKKIIKKKSKLFVYLNQILVMVFFLHRISHFYSMSRHGYTRSLCTIQPTIYALAAHTYQVHYCSVHDLYFFFFIFCVIHFIMSLIVVMVKHKHHLNWAWTNCIFSITLAKIKS